MREGTKLLIVILFLPFVAALGFDLYANYFTDVKPALSMSSLDSLESVKIAPEAFRPSDLGYILVKYAKPVYDAGKNAVPPATWDRFIEPVLETYTFAVALAPLVLFGVWMLIARIFDIWPFIGVPTRAQADHVRPGQTRTGDGGRVKYKRR